MFRIKIQNCNTYDRCCLENTTNESLVPQLLTFRPSQLYKDFDFSETSFAKASIVTKLTIHYVT